MGQNQLVRIGSAGYVLAPQLAPIHCAVGTLCQWKQKPLMRISGHAQFIWGTWMSAGCPPTFLTQQEMQVIY